MSQIRKFPVPFASKIAMLMLESFLRSLYAADKPETPPPTIRTSTSSLEFILVEGKTFNSVDSLCKSM